MKKKPAQLPTLNAAELQLIEQLRKHPELFERVRSILELASSGEGPIRKADEIEALVIEEMRRLGHATMETWAGKAEQTLADQLKQKDASASVRKKKR
jgi:hypothetical protein